MDRSRKQLLELTRSSLWGSELNISLFENGVDWGQLFLLAKEQTLSGLILSSIEKLPLSIRPDRMELLVQHQKATRNRQLRAYQIDILSELIKLMQSIGIERPVLLKGLGVGMNYLDPTVRQCGDIDLYIGEQMYEECCDMLVKKFGVVRDEHSECEHHIEFIYRDIPVEIHRFVVSPQSIAFKNREFIQWSKSELEGEELREEMIGDVKVYLPPYNFDFIFIFYHIWKHFLSEGVGIRQLCDWALYINRFYNKLDSDEIKKLISLFNLEIPYKLFTAIVVEKLGVDKQKIPYYKEMKISDVDSAFEKIWSGGNFGIYHKNTKRVKSKILIERKIRGFVFFYKNILFLLSIYPLYTFKIFCIISFRRSIVAFRQFDKLFNKL